MTPRALSILLSACIVGACLLSFHLGQATERSRKSPALPAAAAPTVGAVTADAPDSSIPLSRATFPAETRPVGDIANQLFLNPDFGRCEMMFLGCTELAKYHLTTLEHILAAATRKVRVVALVNDSNQQSAVENIMTVRNIPPERVLFLHAPLDSMWIRDFGPLFVLRRDTGRVFLMDADYAPDDDKHRWRDDEFPILLSRMTQLERVSIPLRLEGGNILSNGDGLLVSTNSIVGRNESRGYDLHSVGSLLWKSFGFREWVHLEPLEDEPTGHADMFVTLLAEDLAVVGKIDFADDPVNARRLDEWSEQLSGVTTSFGKKIRVERIPVPPRRGTDWMSYNNVIILNKMIMIPKYSDVAPALRQAMLDTYTRLLPDWEIVEIPADTLVKYRGLLRCVTLNVPWYVPLVQHAN